MNEEQGTAGSPPVDGDELRAAVERLAAGDRLAEAEQMVSTALPELRVLLAEALGTGGWFGEPHQSETLRVATIPDPDERLEALRNLLEEETNIGMMVGVAVGWALRSEIDGRADDQSTAGSEGA
ncbi:MAG: hypothetical protein ACKOL0_05735 [Solirubrobacterales bacterium]